MVPVEPPRPSVCGVVHIHVCSVFTRQGFVNPDPMGIKLVLCVGGQR